MFQYFSYIFALVLLGYFGAYIFIYLVLVSHGYFGTCFVCVLLYCLNNYVLTSLFEFQQSCEKICFIYNYPKELFP